MKGVFIIRVSFDSAGILCRLIVHELAHGVSCLIKIKIWMDSALSFNGPILIVT